MLNGVQIQKKCVILSVEGVLLAALNTVKKSTVDAFRFASKVLNTLYSRSHLLQFCYSFNVPCHGLLLFLVLEEVTATLQPPDPVSSMLDGLTSSTSIVPAPVCSHDT